MALISPGVQVSVIDESFYTPAEPGTRPLFIVATAQDKVNGSGTGTAQGTLAANAGKVYLLTSQRDLVDTFGDPVFKVDANNNPIHAGEQNEYGLQAAYSYLGVSNSAFVVRADIDLNLLDAQADAPGGAPADGTFWLDTATSTFGVFQWNGAPATTTGGQSFTTKVPTVILDSTKLDAGGPLDTVGAVGEYAIVPGADQTGTTVDDRNNHVLSLYYKSRYNPDGSVGSASWVKVGSDGWRAAWPTVQGESADSTGLTIDSGKTLVITAYTAAGSVVGSAKTVTASGTTLASLVSDINGGSDIGVEARVVDSLLQLFVTSAEVERVVVENGNGTLVGTSAKGTSGLTAGTYYAPALAIQAHTSVPQWKLNKAGNLARPTGSVWIKTTEPNAGARWRLKSYNANTLLWNAVEAPLYSSSAAALAALSPVKGGTDLAINTAYVQFNLNGSESDIRPEGDFRVMRRARTGATSVKTKVITSGTLTVGNYRFKMAESKAGDATLSRKLVSVSITGTAADATAIANAINNAFEDSSGTIGNSSPFVNIIASVSADNRVVIEHKLGGEIRFADLGDSVNFVGTQLGLTDVTENLVYEAPTEDSTFAYVASNWVPLTITPDTSTQVRQSYYISATAPETLPADGTLWYSSVVDEVDIMVHNGEIWTGYKTVYADTNPTGPIVAASTPTTQTDGTPLVDGDLWVDTSDLANYPLIKRYNGDFGRWDTLDTSDQTTENGVLFADARSGTTGGTTNVAPTATITALLTSNYVDFDAPDPALYPQGMLLWNTRRSGYNVKKFVRNYIDVTADNIRYKADFNDIGDRPTSGDAQTNYYPHRWVTASANQADGSGSFGRKAQRRVVITALQALVNSNEDLRDTEIRNFNLIAAPGYPELIGEMISLNVDRRLTAFVVGDTPARLVPDATTINDWGNNVAGALQDNDDGLVSYDEYMGVFYPWGFTSDNAGRDIAVPPSHMICRMIALSDQVSYPWFAPAGTRRGGITNATAVGYISNEGEFVSVALNEGQRDTLYNVKVNPITFFTGAGLVNFGQKTRARNASALDRINVARLVIYLRSQLNKLAKPYIFEPNDKVTRDEIKQQVESLLLELVGQRALYDFLVVCDESNNTPTRIDRNELYVDIAIEPVKAVEFIYIPVRLKNTGEIAGLG